MEVAVSADYVQIFKKYLGVSLGDGWIGALGSTSSALILFVGGVHAYRDFMRKKLLC